MGWKNFSSVFNSSPITLERKVSFSLKLLTVILFTVLSFGSTAFGAMPVAPDRKATVDCLSKPSSYLGSASLTLIACFEEVELGLNDLMRSAVSQPPFDKFDLALIDLHKRATARAVRGLRDTIQQLVQGNEVERQLLADFEFGITEGLLLEETGIIVGLMRVSGGSGEGQEKDKGKEVQESIKKIIEKALDSVLGKQFASLFEVIDELVRLFVKT
jgi:hypothetical protein